MEEASKEPVNLVSENKGVVYVYETCQSREANWLCLENIYQKFYRANFYDIGGTYIEDVADFWFLYKTEQVGQLFLLHLFVCNRTEGSFSLGVSFHNDLILDKKNEKVYLTTSLNQYQFKKKDATQHYITTYSFTNLEVEFMKDRKLYIAVSFSVSDERGISQEILEDVKMRHDFSALLDDPIGSDFTIESSNGDKFKVHKALLAAHSEVFKAMLKEETAESQNSYVKLVDVSTEDLCGIIEFIYTGTVKNMEDTNFFNLLMLADQYNLIGLRELSEYALSQQMTIDNALEVLSVADLYNSGVLKMKALMFLKKNAAALQTSAFKEMNVDLVKEICEYLITPNQ